MISFWRIFWLELTAFVRSKSLAALMAVSVAWMFALPYLVRGDGTADGVRELYVHYSLGGVFALLVVTLLASATGSLARERAAKRLQLTMVRPVRYFTIALGKIVALVSVGALVLAVVCAVLAFRVDLSRPCNHVLSPVLPTPQEEARAMYDVFMNDPETPPAVKRARKGTVLRLLAQRAMDNYQTVQTNDTAIWRFPGRETDDTPAVRLRFTNQLDMRQDVFGILRIGSAHGTVSNITQAVVTVPLTGDATGADELVFENHGTSALMLRPRRDINLLVRADDFGKNLVRTYAELVAILSLIVSLGMLLSAGLGRPVALFVAFVALTVGEMSPSVIEQYPDELETKTVDRIGLHVTRFAAEATKPIFSLSPLAALSADECVESREMGRLLLIDLLLAPIAFSLIVAFVIPRKQEDVA